MGEQLRELAEALDAAVGPPALFALMAQQHGVASTHQSRQLGVSRSVERRLIREGALVEPLVGVLAAGGIRPSYSAQAMSATLLPGAVALSHGAAARVHRLAGFGQHPTLDVIGARGAHLHTRRPVVAHYTRGPVEDYLVNVGPLTVTSVPLTLVLLAPECAPEMLAAAFHDALQRGVAPADIRAVLGDWQIAGRAGPNRLASLLDEALRPRVAATTNLEQWRRRRDGAQASPAAVAASGSTTR